MPSKATLHIWDVVLWTAHASDSWVGPGDAAAAAASKEELPNLHPARCVLLWVAMRIVALAREAMGAGEEEKAAKGKSALTLEAVLKSLNEAAAKAGNLLELSQGNMPEFQEIASKAQTIAAQRAELEKKEEAKSVKETKDAPLEAPQEEAETNNQADENDDGDDGMEEAEEEGEHDVESDDGSGGGEGKDESSGLADLEALADESGSPEDEATALDGDRDDDEDDEEEGALVVDELIVLLTDFGLASMHGVLASAARGKSAQHLVDLGQKQVVALGVPFIKARKMLAKAEAMAAAAATSATASQSSRSEVATANTSPVRESKAHDLTPALLPETPVEKQRSGNLSSSAQPSTLLSPETPEKSAVQPLRSAAAPAAPAEVEDENLSEVDELALLLEEFGVGSLHGVLASAAKGTSAQQLLALGQKGAVALGLPFIKARKLWAKAETMAAASTASTCGKAAGATSAAAGAEVDSQGTSAEGGGAASKNKWKIAASEAVDMHRSDEAAAAEMSALIGLSSGTQPKLTTAASKGLGSKDKKHFSDVVLEAFEANALDSVRQTLTEYFCLVKRVCPFLSCFCPSPISNLALWRHSTSYSSHIRCVGIKEFTSCAHLISVVLSYMFDTYACLLFISLIIGRPWAMTMTTSTVCCMAVALRSRLLQLDNPPIETKIKAKK